jgi:hypothetical protein
MAGGAVHLKEVIMMVNKLYVLTLALTGCAAAVSAYVVRHHSRREEARQHKDVLHTWEGEGGKPASQAASAAQAG